MTEQQLALALVKAGVLTTERVQAAARLRTPSKDFARVLIEMEWVSPQDILKIDANALQYL